MAHTASAGAVLPAGGPAGYGASEGGRAGAVVRQPLQRLGPDPVRAVHAAEVQRADHGQETAVRHPHRGGLSAGHRRVPGGSGQQRHRRGENRHSEPAGRVEFVPVPGGDAGEAARAGGGQGRRRHDGHPGRGEISAGVHRHEEEIVPQDAIIIGEPFEPVYTGRKGTAEEYTANSHEVMRRAYALGGVSWK